MEKQTKTVRGLINIQGFHLVAENINLIFLTLYIWKSSNISNVIVFRLTELLLIPIAALVAGFLIDKISAKLTLSIGMILLFVQLLAVSILQTDLVNYLLPLALLSGVSSVFRFLSLNTINQYAVALKEQVSYFAKLSINSKIVSIIFPLISGFIIYLFGYIPIFVIALISIVILLLILLSTPIKVEHNSYKPWEVLFGWDREKTVLFGTNFMWGIEYSLFTTVIPIVITIMLKGELGWGIFTAILSVVAIIYANSFKKIKLKKASISALGIFGFLLTSTAIVFATNVNLISFSLFMIVLQLWQTTQMVGLKPLLNKIIKSETHSSVLTTEFNVFMEIPFMVGRMIMMVVLFAIGGELENLMMLGFLFALLGFIPLYESKIVAMSKKVGLA